MDHACQRCREREEIPTHQFVKFDTRVHYLCNKCWTTFRRWFHHKPAPDRQLELWQAG